MNPYSVLELDPKASEEVVRAAYKALAHKYAHDDKHFNLVTKAKDKILDPNWQATQNQSSVKEGVYVGDYKLVSKIAEGGFGVTYLAHHKILGSKVCIKHALNISKTDEELLFEEAKSIWDLRHYSIPAIRDIVRLDDGSVALVMSYIEGPTLHQLVEKRALDAEHMAWITTRVLNVLKYLHYHGIVHGDIKPQNIIVQPKSHTVVLVDYGLAAIRPKNGSGNKGYTPLFAAPEQVEGKPCIPETDFYGLGMTMLYGMGGDISSLVFPKMPSPMEKFVKSLIPLQVLSRPSWERVDIEEEFAKVREKSFGSRSSNMKNLDFDL